MEIGKDILRLLEEENWKKQRFHQAQSLGILRCNMCVEEEKEVEAEDIQD